MRSILLLCFLFPAAFGFSQTILKSGNAKLRLTASPTQEVIHPDGILNEQAWKGASATGNFIQEEPNQGEQSHFRTEVRAVYNDKALFISFICYDTIGKKAYRSPNLKRDFDYLQNDMVAVGIDGFNDERNSVTFAANAYGAQKDYLSFDDTYFDGDWNGLWSVRTSRTDSCWIAEFELPWKTLRYKKTEEEIQSMGINLLRLRRNSNEISVWSAYPRSFGFNRMEYAGILTGLKPPKPSSNIQVTPYTLVATNIKKGYTPATETSNSFKAGGEIKWAITPSLVGDATFNTDFAQADADLQVNNLSRFSIFFPEKRQFFLENASLFGAGLIPGDEGAGGNMVIQPFFSRRIGLDDDGNPIPISAGGRIVYRSAQKNFGGMYLRQQASGDNPAINFAIGRYSQNIGKYSRVGALVVSKFQEKNSIKSAYNNIVGGIDAFFRMGRAHSLSLMILRSGNGNTQQYGYGGFAQYYYTSNILKAWVTESFVTRQFNPEAGFLSRTDVVNTAPGFILNIRRKWLPAFIREFTPGVYSEWYHQASTGHLQERSIKISPLYFTFSNGGVIGFSVVSNKQILTEDFEPLGIVIGKGSYSYFRNRLYYKTDESRRISGSIAYEWGDYYNGKLATIEATLSLAPVPFASLNLSTYNNHFRHTGINEVTQQVDLYTAEGRFALNPRIQLAVLYQRNSVNSQDSYNVRFSWEYKPLSYIYLVWNSRSQVTSNRQTEQAGIVKLSYLKQF